MKPIGIIGGLTYVSTLEYYRYINEIANKELGGNETVEVIMYSVNFGEIKKHTEADDWNKLAEIMIEKARLIESDGAGCLLITANTMHKIADEVQAAINIPVIHIAEAVAQEVLQDKLKTVGLLGTRYTMQLGFYTEKLSSYNIKTIIPEQEEIEFVNRTIYNEFSKNIFLTETKTRYLDIINKLQLKGAEGIILGCTEIPLLISQSECELPLFNTAKIHSQAGVDFVIKNIE